MKWRTETPQSISPNSFPSFSCFRLFYRPHSFSTGILRSNLPNVVRHQWWTNRDSNSLRNTYPQFCLPSTGNSNPSKTSQSDIGGSLFPSRTININLKGIKFTYCFHPLWTGRQRWSQHGASVFFYESIRSGRIGTVKLNFIRNKECQEERPGVTNDFNLCKSSNQNTFSTRNSKGDRLNLFFGADDFELFWSEQLRNGTWDK
mmetsp:Transcript_20716/g.45100  ORF Transcript_20716/g.45100 Transcript_20716/m.45100 type:complete len:203 (-) Transcript_20716:1838-2446(-)